MALFHPEDGSRGGRDGAPQLSGGDEAFARGSAWGDDLLPLREAVESFPPPAIRFRSPVQA